MLKVFTLFSSIIFFFSSTLVAQLSAPEVEGVYGGRINGMASVKIDSTHSRMYISTESANTLFYADVSFEGDSIHSDGFFAVPDANEDDGFGRDVRVLTGDSKSGFLYFVSGNKVYGVSDATGSIIEVADGGIQGIKAHDGIFFFATKDGDGLNLHFGDLNASDGSFTENGDSPINVTADDIQSPNGLQMFINPVNNKLYIAAPGHPANIYKSSATYDSLSAATSFSSLLTGGMGSGKQYQAFGMGPDGKLFAGTTAGKEPNHSKFIAYTKDDGATWDTLSTNIGGVASSTITCSGSDTSYHVYFGAAVSNNRGESGTWQSIGWMGFQTHPNDGHVEPDAVKPGMVYMTTDMGIGASDNYGGFIFEIDEGVEAVQIQDFDMNAAKTDAWLSSKSGIRRVRDYGTEYAEWQVFFPNGDGSPYYSIAVDKQRPDTAYAGNIRLYRTFDGGNTWDQVFRTEDYWGTQFDFWSFVSDVTVHPDSSNFVVLGVNSPASGLKGAVFYSFDHGTTWNQVETDVYNTEVNRLAIDPVDSDSFTVYVACEYVSDGTTSSYGVKKIGFRFSDEKAVFHNEMTGKSGGPITNFGATDIAVHSNGDVVTSGVNSSNEPRTYAFWADSSYWNNLANAGLPSNGAASAISWGFDAFSNDVPYIAVDNSLYAMSSDGSGWGEVYTYPFGTQINVLYWDDLLVGTGTGLYAQFLSPTGIEDLKSAPGSFELKTNYPNPFNPETIIEYRLGVNSDVQLTVFDLLGRKVKVLEKGIRLAGSYQITFDASKLASGIYFYRLKARPVNGGRAFVETHRMLLMK
jgi:Secretion system C-terminal sorting domain